MATKPAAKKTPDTKKTVTETPLHPEAVKELVKVSKEPTAEQAKEQAAKEAKKAEAKEKAKRLTDEKKAQVEDTRRALLSEARKAGLTIEERGGVWKVLSEKSKLWMSISKKGTTLHLVGFNVESPLVEKITPEQAKARHIGNVRGEADLSADRSTLQAVFAKCLAAIQVAAVLGLIVQ